MGWKPCTLFYREITHVKTFLRNRKGLFGTYTIPVTPVVLRQVVPGRQVVSGRQVVPRRTRVPGQSETWVSVRRTDQYNLGSGPLRHCRDDTWLTLVFGLLQNFGLTRHGLNKSPWPLFFSTVLSTRLYDSKSTRESSGENSFSDHPCSGRGPTVSELRWLGVRLRSVLREKKFPPLTTSTPHYSFFSSFLCILLQSHFSPTPFGPLPPLSFSPLFAGSLSPLSPFFPTSLLTHLRSSVRPPVPFDLTRVDKVSSVERKETPEESKERKSIEYREGLTLICWEGLRWNFMT